jgi:two-component system CheB/CheR fusion protein
MPFSAIDTGLVDYVTQPAKMPAQLMAYVAHAFGKLPRLPSVPPLNAENDRQKIFILLRAQTGHDFSQYKPRTIHRRIERRMAVHQIESIDGYVKYAQQTPAEVEALFRDLLIGVTSFFRDPDAFAVLEEKVIPTLLANKPPGSLIRVWVPGCSTGEEAYSIAILLVECMEKLHRSYNFQIFATDIDSRAISSARSGHYSANISTDMSAERLSRYFIPDPDSCGYRILKVIRDMLVFSEQNVIKDPPFSKLDFISCRNLLIYMNGDLQKKIIPLFHFALNLDGYLFLGTSETIGEFEDLFAVKDRKQKIYKRKEVPHLIGLNRFHPPRLTTLASTVPQIVRQPFYNAKLPLRELAEHALLQQIVEAAALVNSNGDGLYFHGRTGLYLEPAPGEATVNILKMAREGLRRDLTMALHKAVASREVVSCQGLKVKTNGDYTSVNLIVRPVESGPSGNLDTPLYLVILGQAQPCIHEVILSAAPKTGEKEGKATSLGSEARIAALQQELRAKEEYLQATTEELQTSNEELKSSNEEMQSVNEELQSTNEELETSKEELQSINEELATVNAELQTKVSDLARANNDMNNLLAGTGIATVFVDHSLRILRFTPAATRVINVSRATSDDLCRISFPI